MPPRAVRSWKCPDLRRPQRKNPTVYQYSETESEDADHVEREDQALTVASYQITEFDATTGRTVTRAVSSVIVCSCGSRTCGAIRRFGLPTPVFEIEIEPLAPQSLRDNRAAAIKADASD